MDAYIRRLFRRKIPILTVIILILLLGMAFKIFAE